MDTAAVRPARSAAPRCGRVAASGAAAAMFATIMLVAACGGGGGAAGGGGAVGGLVYSGSTSPAAISPTNAGALAATVIGNGDAAAAVAGVALSGDAPPAVDRGIAAISGRLAHRLRNVVPAAWQAAAVQPAVAALQIDETEFCDAASGTVRTFGNVDDTTLTGTLTLVFTNCLSDGDTLDGQATLRIDAFDIGFLLPTDATYGFSRLSLRAAGLSVDLGGTLRVQLNIGASSETVTSNIVMRDNLAGVMSKTEGLVSSAVVDSIFFPQSSTQTVAGRVFHSLHGYVDVTTAAPLVYGALAQAFPGTGELRLGGAANARIRLSAVTSAVVALALDLGGDGIDDLFATLAWSELAGPAGANLVDSDGDGMHDSWETASALDPNDPADAALDRDGDGASNREEYDMATAVGDANSTPPAVDAAISLTATPPAVAVGGQISYAIVVTRPSFAAPIVYDIVVTADLPAGVTLVSAIPERGSCSGTTTLACRLGNLDSFTSVALAVVVTPAAAGDITNAFALGARSFDPNPANDSAAASTTVGLALAGIQAQIDAAAPGTAIVVPAGVYVGALDFGGKNVTLASAAGPATTTIRAVGGTAVRIGPGGTLSGFTITGSETAVQAFGSGSLITGNVFAGNSGNTAGVFGNPASPTIERNVFRENACDTQSSSGVVVFFNDSSPRIANNVFANNQCRGVNLTLPSGPAPVTINNSFVGNRTAIRVDRRVSQTAQVYRNNLVVQNGTGFEVEFGSEADSPVWTNNLMFGNVTDYLGIAEQTGINGNLAANPLLIDVAGENYRLQAGSPAIDAGSASDAPGIDFDGNPRPQDGDGVGGAAFDIGAFEAPAVP